MGELLLKLCKNIFNIILILSIFFTKYIFLKFYLLYKIGQNFFLYMY